jgi:hypothetical protein
MTTATTTTTATAMMEVLVQKLKHFHGNSHIEIMAHGN